MGRVPINYWQTILSDEEHQRATEYLHKNNVKNKREWIKSIIMKEVTNYEHAIRLHESIPTSEEPARGLKLER